MTEPEHQIPEAPLPRDMRLSPAERALLDHYDAQRRLTLLRIIVPGLFAVALFALPFGIQADLEAHTITSTTQDAVGLIAFAIALWATRKQRADLASAALFAGVTGTVVLLLLNDGPLNNMLDLTAVPVFALFTLPIAIAGIFGRPYLVALATLACVTFTLLVMLLTPHTPALRAALNQPGGMALFTIPISAQIALGVLMFAANRGFRRTVRELGAARLAYAREKEMDIIKDRFIDSVNHELRTPIMALQGYIELARTLGTRGSFERQEYMLERAEQASDHLVGIVRSVLSARRVETDANALTLSRFALRPVIIAATSLLDPREAGEEDRTLHLRVPDDLRVYADEDLVRQVTLNLLSNAAKYSPPGSPIEVDARVVAPATSLLSIARLRRGTPQQPVVEVSVHDHGLGVPPEQAGLLFQRFARLERDTASAIPGTGLGLAICRAYVEAMGGSIWLESEGLPGGGSTFRFTLPLATTGTTGTPDTTHSADATDTTAAPPVVGATPQTDAPAATRHDGRMPLA